MENRKDIGKIFADKLSSLEKTPKDNVWNGIKHELEKKKKRRVVPILFWTKTIGVLLLGALTIFCIYNYECNKLPKNNSEEVNNIDKTSPNNKNNNSANDSGNPISNSSGIHEKTKPTVNKEFNVFMKNEKSLKDIRNEKNLHNEKIYKKDNLKRGYKYTKGDYQTKNNSKLLSKKKKLITNNLSEKRKGKFKSKKSNPKSKNIAEENIALPLNVTSLQVSQSTVKIKESSTKKPDSVAQKKEKEKTININMYAEDKTQKDSIKRFRKFDLDVFASPVYYGYFVNESTLDKDLDSQSKKSNIKFGYGIGLTYELTEKISVRIGYSKININLTTKDAPVNTANYSGIEYYPNITNQTIASASNGADKMDIIQKIAYSEIPLEVKYQFLDAKIGLKANFGFSYLLLNENLITIETNNGYNQEIGKTKDLSNTSVSLNGGLELDYQIFKNTKLFVETIFNYHIKSNNNNDYKPYMLGLRTGIRYTILNK